MAKLFKRGASVTFVRPLSAKELATPVITTQNAVTVADHRINFYIEKSLSSEPNTCELVIYNLAEQTRKEIQRRPLYVRIDAGYDGRLERVFTGDLRFGASSHNGSEWETRLQLGDGERSFRFGIIDRSYRGGVTAKDAITEIAKSMGLKATFSASSEKELRAQYASGLSLHGTSNRELTRILSKFGMTWSIQDGILRILKANEVSLDEVVIISEDTGMIGSPVFGSPPEGKKLPVLNIQSLLKPSIRPGGRIQVVSQEINGIFRVERGVHAGDTFEETWMTSMEARQVS